MPSDSHLMVLKVILLLCLCWSLTSHLRKSSTAAALNSCNWDMATAAVRSWRVVHGIRTLWLKNRLQSKRKEKAKQRKRKSLVSEKAGWATLLLNRLLQQPWRAKSVKQKCGPSFYSRRTKFLHSKEQFGGEIKWPCSTSRQEIRNSHWHEQQVLRQVHPYLTLIATEHTC